MKATIWITSLFFIAVTCNFNNNLTVGYQPQLLLIKEKELVDFEKDIKPILVKRCSPCHFPGGKMYGRMPFDADTTLINHNESVLKRIKDKDENQLFRNFFS